MRSGNKAVRRIAALAAILVLAGCGSEPVNSPYPRDDAERNVLHTAFTQRSPKYLDPASSYSTDETPFTYSIYEPLYGYHYL
ncbi:MAG TPA: peptide ABC transporter substrate-binding protein, partial [Burkholderiaceae bacterium]|nr:peptide ABC transporter substrate-binding protein [Burkholderiaceae bacterium]